jgi:hypothetical protein
MAALVTDAEVKEIIEVDDSISLTPFISIANLTVINNCTGIAADVQKEVERWLSAHFYAIRDQRIASEGVGGVQASYQYRVGFFLENTMYGQQAMLLDNTGGLSRLNSKMKDSKKSSSSITYLGTE